MIYCYYCCITENPKIPPSLHFDSSWMQTLIQGQPLSGNDGKTADNPVVLKSTDPICNGVQPVAGSNEYSLQVPIPPLPASSAIKEALVTMYGMYETKQ